MSTAYIRAFYRIFELFYRFIVSLPQGKKALIQSQSVRNKPEKFACSPRRSNTSSILLRCWLQILPRDGFRFPTQGSLKGDPMHARQGFGSSRRVTLLRGHPAASIKRGPKADNP